MKIMNCPLNGPRNITEFSYGGEFHRMPDPSKCEPRAWAEYIFFHDNHAGIVTEWWLHNATSYWFLAKRNTVTDEIIRTFPASDVFNERVYFKDDDTGRK
jgi:sarcosine oxidase, subunit delta